MKCLKNNYKSIFSFLYHNFIIVGLVFISYALISINFKSKINPTEIINNIRKLSSGSDKQKAEDICLKADNDLNILYEKDSYSYNKSNVIMKKSTSHLLSYIENQDKEHLKNYIFSFYAQIIILIFEIVLVVIWIVLCFFIMKKDSYLYCLLKLPCVDSCLKTFFFIISILMYLIIIILNLFILFSLPIFLQDIINSFCSFFKISYHTHNGEEDFYEIRPKWTGINQIKNLIQKTKENLDNLIDQNKQINQKINEFMENIYFNPDNNSFIEKHINELCNLDLFPVPNPNPLSEDIIYEFLFCSDILSTIQKEYNETFYSYILEIHQIYQILSNIEDNKIKMGFSLDNAKNKIDSFVKIINDIENDYFNSLIYLFETIIRKYLIYIFVFFFIITLLFEFAGFIIIVILKLCYSYYCNKVYNFIWNVQYICIMIILLIVVCSSTLKIFMDDISIILKTAYNSEEIKENRTFSNYNYDMEGINTCIIEDGDLARYMNLDKEAEQLSHFYSMINIINYNLNYFRNYKIYENNETKNILDEVEKNKFLSQFKLERDKNITNAEEILEKYLNLYTDNEKNQDLSDNEYYANYFFVYDTNFCKKDYKILFNTNQIGDSYKDGKNCITLKDFPENTNYFKSLKAKNIENLSWNNNDLDDLVRMFKERYYFNGWFDHSFSKLLENSRNYLKNKISEERNKLHKDIITIYETLKNKINIIHNLYKGILKPNSTDLFSAFNCNYLKRDFYIFLDQLDDKLNSSLKKLTVLGFILAIFSFLSIIFSLFLIKLYKIERKKEEEDLFKPEEKVEKKDIREKPKIKTVREKFNFDEGVKSSGNENTGLKKRKNKHVIDIVIENKE